MPGFLQPVLDTLTPDLLLLLGVYGALAVAYLVVVPLALYAWMVKRWTTMGKLERFGVYGLVFLFFPGLILFAPFINLRMAGQGQPVTKGQSLLLGLAVLGFGALGYGLFQAGGLEGFNAGIAASALLMVLVLGWTASYLLRAVTGNMTYMQQRRTYRSAYDAHTTEVLEKKFAALSPEEQQQLLEQAAADREQPGEA